MEHIIFKNQNLLCTNCGSTYQMKMPIAVSEYSKKVQAFNDLHSDCEKTWEEPKVNQSESEKEKAMWWIANGFVGLSSKTMWNFFMGNKDFIINHPYDPDDFSRCYKLLETVPEWKSRVSELSVLSKEWKNLSKNWEKLTEMYEQNNREAWTNYKEIGMYELMQKLLAT